MTAMRYGNNNKQKTTNSDSPDRFFCQLFDDMIIREVCILRRRELNNRNRFSCDGCGMDTHPASSARTSLNLCSLSE